MAQINTEFGRGNNLNSYRGTTYYTSGGGPFTFPAGAISFSNFYGTQATSPTFAFTIAANLDQANLRTLAVNAGWNQSSPVVATFAAGYWIYSSTTGAPALTIDGSWPGGVTFINNQYVIGMGGNGGAGGVGVGTVGLAGGTALAVSTPVTIYNYSYIAGGGGGGGGGGGYTVSQYVVNGGGGGGGGGTGLGTSLGGAGSPGLSGVAGQPGSNNYANSGGAAGGAGGTSAGAGGSGGGWGAAGNTGGNGTSAGAAGGAAGNCTSGNGFITWAVTGNRLGPLG
jgi:hypothetical protein